MMQTMTVNQSDNPDGNQNGGPFSAIPMPGIGDVLKWTAVAGAVIYAALFTGYRTYYNLLGIRPEDVGVNNTFILVRSIGFVLLSGVVAAGVFLLTMGYYIQARQRGRRSLVWVMIVGGLLTGYIAVLLPPNWSPGIVIPVIVIPVGVLLPIASIGLLNMVGDKSQRNVLGGILGVVVAAVLIIVLPALAINGRAENLAKAVLSGHQARPFTILSIIPVLDVSSDLVQATWICPDPERPLIFREAVNNTRSGLLLGESGTTYFIRLSDTGTANSEIIKLPENCVMATRSGS
jgi:hypothetical protein